MASATLDLPLPLDQHGGDAFVEDEYAFIGEGYSLQFRIYIALKDILPGVRASITHFGDSQTNVIILNNILISVTILVI